MIILITGYQNEFDFVLSINRKKFCELNPLLSELIVGIFGNVDQNAIIKSWRNHYSQKTDVLIKIGDVIKRISIKMGSRNSVHQESLKTFISFLEENGVPRYIIEKYLIFHYGDGTLNGTGSKRYAAIYLRHSIKCDIDNINIFFNNKSLVKDVCDRFLIKGLIFNDRIDALVYGTPNDFLWIKSEDIYKLMEKKINNKCSSPHFGFLVVQPLNRCINYNNKYDYARHKVQLKWYTLFDDIMYFLNEKESSKLIT